MTEKEYIDKLEELSFSFRDDNHLCSKSCNECRLNQKVTMVHSGEIVTYCGILTSIYNQSLLKGDISTTQRLKPWDCKIHS